MAKKKDQTKTPAPRDPASNLAREQARLKYLQRVDPKSPEIKKLQKSIAIGGTLPKGKDGNVVPSTTTTTTGTATTPPQFNRQAVDDFIANSLNGLGELDLSGAPQIMTAADLEKFRQENQDALYNEETKYLDRNRQRNLEEVKQEMANRGIPYNPAAAQDANTQDLYGRTVGAVDESYRTQQQSALDRARTGADARMTTQAGVNKAAYDQFVNSAVSGYESKVKNIGVGNDLLNSLITESGMSKEEILAKLKMKSDERIANAQIAASNRNKGGGGGSSSSGGFEIAG
jgi:hypothetical protein